MDGGGADDDGKFDLEFQQNSNKSVMSCSTSGMMTTQLPNKASELAMSSTSMFKSSGGSDPFFEPHWNPLLAVNQNANYGGSSMVSHCGYTNQPSYSMENQGAVSSHLGQYPSSGSSLLDLPKIHHFGSGNFSDMTGLYGLPALGPSANNRCYENYLTDHETGTHRTNAGSAMSQEDCQVSGERVEASPNRKSRRRSIEPAVLNPIKVVYLDLCLLMSSYVFIFLYLIVF